MASKVPIDYDKFLTDVSKKRTFSQLRALGKYMGDKRYRVLAGGVPTPKVFHFSAATFKLRDGSQLEFDEENMIDAQQYGRTNGLPQLYDLMHDFTERLHHPPSDNWTMMLTTGCQQSIHTALQIIMEAGDTIIVGDYCYTGALDIMRPMGLKFLAIESDSQGMRSDDLREALSRCNESNKPKMMYIVPNGGNPDSVTMTAERRRELYKIAQEYDFIILEDDPYQFLVFDTESPPISFLSLDTDGRVIRCDSISKIISPGFRLGVLTAAEPFVNATIKHLEVSNQQPCCLSQVVVYKLLQKWGFDGYIKKAQRARDIFKNQKDLCFKSAQKHLTGLVEVEPPSGGFFLWVKLKGIDDAREICEKCITKGVVFVPGTWFTYDLRKSPFIRVSYSTGDEEHFDVGFRILADVLREHLQAKTNGHITNGMINGTYQ